MRPRGLYDLEAPKQTVSLPLNSDLNCQAMRLGINMSLVAEEALAREVAERIRAEVAPAGALVRAADCASPQPGSADAPVPAEC